MMNTRPNEIRVNLKALAVLERRGLGQLDEPWTVLGPGLVYSRNS